MTTKRFRAAAALVASAALVLAGCTAADDVGDEQPDGTPTETAEEETGATGDFTTREVTDGRTTFVVVENPGDGPRLSYGADGSIELLTEEIEGQTYAFKDMNANGTLDVWEDWREPVEARAADLAEQLSIEQIAGLMLFSPAERSPGDGLTDDQRAYLADNNLRNVLNNGPSEVEANVTWVNEMQAFVEALATEDAPYVPVNYSSDPKSIASGSVGGSSNPSPGGAISRWPSNLGLAAAYDSSVTEAFARAASAEYRALGITTALSPQIDLATEPRWTRVSGTFGEDSALASRLTVATVDGFQNSYDESGTAVGWGDDSVIVMIKHFPGDGMGEGGRESHMNSGKYAVYPGDNFDEHLEPFLAALNTASVMTSYSIALDGDGNALFEDRVGMAYDKERVDILRVDNGYEGVIVTDWGVTSSRAWGMEDLSEEERHFAVIRAGHDMFGGNTEAAPILAAFDLWQAAFEAGELDIDAETRFRQSATRILGTLFKVGLYESPYLELEVSQAIVGSADKVEAGQDAQLNSVVMLKNAENTISSSSAADWSDKTVYIPRSYHIGFATARAAAQYTEAPTLDLEVAAQYFGQVLTDEVELDEEGRVVSYTAPDLSEVDLVLVGMRNPDNGTNQSSAGLDTETGVFYPLSLQYRPYTADGPNVRQVSISGDILADGTRENRSYFGETSRIANEADLDAFERATAAVEAAGRDIPVISIIKANNALIPAEFESRADAILVGFGVTDSTLLQIALGLHEPQGRLPIVFPADMDTVEAQAEDVADDMEPYVDGSGNTYGLGFGLNWSGSVG